MKTKTKFQSALRYPGGKSRMVKELSQYLPAEKINLYVEPFAGGASLFYYVKNNNLAKYYGLSDAYGVLIDFYQTVADYSACEQLRRAATFIYHRFPNVEDRKKWFENNRDFANFPYKQHRALSFFIYNRITFSGTIEAGGFSYDAAMSRFTLSSIERLVSMPEALKDTFIVNNSFEVELDCLKSQKNVLLYLDPPYYSNEKLYGEKGSLHQIDHGLLAKLLQETPNKFLLSYDDCKEVRELYSKWAQIHQSSEQAYGMSNGKRKQELIITNY